MITTEVGPLDKRDKQSVWGYVVRAFGLVYAQGTRPTEKAAREAASDDAKIARLFAHPTHTRSGPQEGEQEG